MNTRTTVNTFIEYIVNCVDLDSKDEFNTTVLINELETDERRRERIAEDAASKCDLVQMSGNTLEFTLEGPTGRVVKQTKVVTQEELSPRSPEAEEELNRFNID